MQTESEKRQKMSNWTVYKMAISDFQNFWFLTHKNQNSNFSKINTYKIKILEDIQKKDT